MIDVSGSTIVYKNKYKEITLTATHRATVEKLADNKKKFSLFFNNDEIDRFEYIFSDELLNLSPFEYIDEEDFDWGFFLSEIINNPDRQRRLIDNI